MKVNVIKFIQRVIQRQRKMRSYPFIREARLNRLLPIGNCTIGIVGNGASELERANGGKIENFDYVFRFNNYSLDQVYVKDYGKKTDAWVTCLAHDVKIPAILPPMCFCPFPVLSIDSHFSVRYPIAMAFPPTFRSQIHIVPESLFSGLVQYNVNPSSGLAMLYWIYRENGRSLSGVKLFGFSFFQEIKHHYFDDYNQCTHDGLSERGLVEMMYRGELQ